MINISSRFALALKLGYASMCVLLTGHAPDKKPDNSITPLAEEFSDILNSNKRKQFVERLYGFLLTYDSPFMWEWEAKERLESLLETTLLPSFVLNAFCDALLPTPAKRAHIRECPYLDDVVRKTAIEIGIPHRFIELIWRTDDDLDAIWHTLRTELLAIRAELTQGGVQ